MPTVSAPYGLQPIWHPSGVIRPRQLEGGIVSGYGSNIFTGSPVKVDSATGYIAIAANTDAIVGSFAGCTYVDATGRPRWSPVWLANTVATQIVAYFYDDPTITYQIQTNGSVAQTAIGQQLDFVNAGAGNTNTGLSSAAGNSTIITSTNQGVLRILDRQYSADNAWGDTYVNLVVQIADHQYLKPQVAI